MSESETGAGMFCNPSQNSLGFVATKMIFTKIELLETSLLSNDFGKKGCAAMFFLLCFKMKEPRIVNTEIEFFD